MESKNFSIKEALSFGWRKTKENLGFFIALLFLHLAVSSIVGLLLILTIGFSEISRIIWELWNLFLHLGFARICLNFYDGTKNKVSLLFSQKKAFLKYSLIYFLITATYYLMVYLENNLFLSMNGLLRAILFLILYVLLIFFVDVRLRFSEYFIVDKNSGPLEAIRNSWNLTRGIVFKLFFFYLILILINILGLLFYSVDLLIPLPLWELPLVFVYRKLLEQYKLSSKAAFNN